MDFISDEDEKLKKELLDRYARMNPSRFILYCGMGDAPENLQDSDGDLIIGESTIELIPASSVSVYIAEGTLLREAVRLLRKITLYVKKYGINPDRVDSIDFY